MTRRRIALLLAATICVVFCLGGYVASAHDHAPGQTCSLCQGSSLPGLIETSWIDLAPAVPSLAPPLPVGDPLPHLFEGFSSISLRGPPA